MLSVITITFNNYDELRSTLDSVTNIPQIESLVVNGGNCSKTLEFLKSYSGKSISEKDSGISDAFNKGWKSASGEAIVFLNSGDLLIDKNYLIEAENIIRTKDVDFIYADMIFEDPIAGDLLIKSVDPLPCMPFNHPTLIVRKEVFNKIGGFNLEYKTAMDLDFVYRMLKVTTKGHYIQKPVVRMDGRGVSSSKHFKVYKEKCVIAVRNGDFSFRAFFILFRHFLSLVLKKSLLALRLEWIIKVYRKMRYKTN